jgi:5-methylcytosine-specific restriction protein A
VFEREHGVCHICELPVTVGQRWEIEHRIPLALGGLDDEANMFPAHATCHKPKSAEDVANIARAKRRKAKHIGIKKPSTWPKSKWRKKVSGEVVLR